MAAAIPWTSDDDAALTTAHAAGDTLTAIAKAIGRSTRSVSEHSAKLGLSWDRSRTEAATQTRKALANERLSQLMLDYLEDAQRFRRINTGGYAYQFVSGSIDAERPYPADQLKLQQASISSAAAALRIMDRDGSSIDQATSLLTSLATAFGVKPVDGGDLGDVDGDA